MSLMSLMQEIREFPVPRNEVAIWWLGQNGFIFKTPEGTLVSTDLYLTNSCAETHGDSGIDVNRQVPILLPPEEVNVDLFACTHNHQDHTDPATIEQLRHRDTTQFIGPHPSCGVFREKGIESGRIVPAWPDCHLEFRDVTIHGTFALPPTPRT